MSDTYTVKDRDIVVVGLQPWDLPIGSNCKNIALEFSKHNRVLYVNAPIRPQYTAKKEERPTGAKTHQNRCRKRTPATTGKKQPLAVFSYLQDRIYQHVARWFFI